MYVLVICVSCRDIASGNNGMEVLFNLLTSTDHNWTKSPELLSVLQPLLMRLCARYYKQFREIKNLGTLQYFVYVHYLFIYIF